jgi:hypothetical protein
VKQTVALLSRVHNLVPIFGEQDCRVVLLAWKCLGCGVSLPTVLIARLDLSFQRSHFSSNKSFSPAPSLQKKNNFETHAFPMGVI